MMLVHLLRRVTLLLVFASVCFFAFPRPAAAGAVRYTYTGNPFSTLTCHGIPCPPGLGLTGSFTLASPLGDNFSGNITPLTFSFSAGPLQSISSSGCEPSTCGLGGPFASFWVQTNASGAITAWSIYLCTIGNCQYDIVINTVYTPDMPGPFSEYDEDNNGDLFGINHNDPGTWSSAMPTPEPSSLLLVATGLLGLCSLIRLRLH